MSASSEPCTSAFSDQVQRRRLAPLDLVEDVLELDAALDRGRRRAGPASRWRCSRASATVLAVFRSGATRNSSPAPGTVDRPSTCTGVDGPASLTCSPWSSIRARTRAPGRAGHDRVADLERALVDEHGGDRAAADVEVGLEHDALGPALGVGGELLDLGDDEQLLEQVVDAEVSAAPTSRP